MIGRGICNTQEKENATCIHGDAVSTANSRSEKIMNGWKHCLSENPCVEAIRVSLLMIVL
jgi:hypothetical protein